MEGDTVLVAAGTYSPSTNSEVFPIEMASGIHLIGSGEDVSIIDAQQTSRVITMEECDNNIISDLTITGGLADSYGGGMRLSNSNPILTNVTIANNTANNGGGGMYLNYSNPIMTNSIIWDNSPQSISEIGQNTPIITYSDIESGWVGGEGNIDADPLLTDPENGDYTLQADSPCIDSGTADLDGDGDEDITDYYGSAPDMGAFEFECSNQGDVNGDGTWNVLDVVGLVNCILQLTCSELDSCATDLNGDGANNVLDVVVLLNCILQETCAGRIDDASNARIILGNSRMYIDANGFIGGVQMTLQHRGDFIIDLTEQAFLADYVTSGNETRLLVINPEIDELFSFIGEFEITDIIIANSYNEISVDMHIVKKYHLGRAYPNPFNPITTISYSTPEMEPVTIKVFDLNGRELETLIQEVQYPGNYQLEWNASSYSSGVYFVQMIAGSYISTQKLMLVK